ncbi:hypothetical protein DSO57_1028803 [Entomophthora muscae]|uniref:Uncharacterized protein n=1 Tax=Entomophthora muscae TaxID=34485 RepID=A0ACC2RG13_9FUNG|nr:hypothetical protein DSO57_1028803 [Entomophthora muscae]
MLTHPVIPASAAPLPQPSTAATHPCPEMLHAKGQAAGTKLKTARERAEPGKGTSSASSPPGPPTLVPKEGPEAPKLTACRAARWILVAIWVQRQGGDLITVVQAPSTVLIWPTPAQKSPAHCPFPGDPAVAQPHLVLGLQGPTNRNQSTLGTPNPGAIASSHQGRHPGVEVIQQPTLGVQDPWHPQAIFLGRT